MKFSKYHGSGNDFILIDNRRKEVQEFLIEVRTDIGDFVRKICAPHTGIGADGLILIEDPNNPDNHFKWKFFNSNGSVGEMCGNGARCAIRFAYDSEVVRKDCKIVRFETLVGVIEGQILEGGRSVKVRLTKPLIIEEALTINLGEITLEGTYLEVGVPHFVVEVKDLEKLDIIKLGREIRRNKAFEPRGTNVNFVKLLGRDTIAVRTYERGVENETLSCGTGVAASALTCFLKGKIKERKVKVITKLGEVLEVSFEDTDELYLKGGVVKVFDGILCKEMFGLNGD